MASLLDFPDSANRKDCAVTPLRVSSRGPAPSQSSADALVLILAAVERGWWREVLESRSGVELP